MAKDSKKKQGSLIQARGSRAPEQPWWRREWLWGLLLIIAVVLAYQPVWHSGFIWDDDSHLTENPCIIGPLGLKEIWTTSAARICPLVLTTFWVEHALWGLNPLPYHLVNVLMHGAGAIVLWRVLRWLRVPGAWLGAALWALHPVQVETVAWITELKNTQSGLFYLFSILFFIKWLSKRGLDAGKGGGWNYALMLFCAALAMASKSSTVILPIVLCLCAWWVEGRWHWRNLARVAPVFLMTVAASALSMWTQHLEGANDLSSVRSGPERLATAGRVVWFYLGKLAWPHPLIFIYPRWEIDAGRWLSYLPLGALMLALLVLWRRRASWGRPYFFALAYFLAALLPVLGLVDHYFLRYSFVGDHFQYLASMGPLALAGAGITTAFGFLKKAPPFLEPAFGVMLLLTLGVLSWRQCGVYQDEETLWRTTIAQNPGCWMAHNNLGDALQQEGQMPEAMEHYEQALRIKPDYDVAHSNLGSVLCQMGRMPEAIGQFEQALQINPNDAEAHYNFGTALQQTGRMPEAMEQYEQALRVKPDYAEAHNNLGLALFQTGHVATAQEQFEEALRIKPDYAEAHNNMGQCFFLLGSGAEATKEFETAIQLKPDNADAHNNLGYVLQQTGRLSAAISQFEQALRIKPDFAVAHGNLGYALQQSGRLPEAIEQDEVALRIKPDFAEAHNNLGIAFYRTGRLSAAIGQFQKALQIKPDFTDARDNLAKLQALQKTPPAKP